MCIQESSLAMYLTSLGNRPTRHTQCTINPSNTGDNVFYKYNALFLRIDGGQQNTMSTPLILWSLCLPGCLRGERDKTGSLALQHWESNSLPEDVRRTRPAKRDPTLWDAESNLPTEFLVTLHNGGEIRLEILEQMRFDFRFIFQLLPPSSKILAY